MIGVNQRTGRLLTRGVEVRIESLSHFMASDGGFASHSTTWSTGFRAIDAAAYGPRVRATIRIVAPAAGQSE